MEEWKRTSVATCEALVNSMPRGLRQCWKIIVVTQNIDTLGPIWTYSLRGVLTFVASGLDNNGCMLSYFEGTANFQCYTSCTLTTLHCSKVSFLQCCHMKIYIIKYLQKCEGCTHFCEILYICVKSSDAKSSKCRLEFLFKISIFYQDPMFRFSKCILMAMYMSFYMQLKWNN